MEEEKEKLQKRFINDIHTIAKNYPEMLDGILTDEVLVWCLTDIDKKLYDSMSTCLNLEKEYNTSGIDPKKKGARWVLFNYNMDRLKEYYNLFLIYDNIRKKRNISFDYNLTIDKYILELQHIFGQDINSKPVSRK